MLEVLKDINPATLVVVGLILILREIFTFLKVQKPKVHKTEVELDAIMQILANVSRHIEAQTKLIEGFVFEIKEFRRDLDELRLKL